MIFVILGALIGIAHPASALLLFVAGHVHSSYGKSDDLDRMGFGAGIALFYWLVRLVVVD